MHASWTAPRAVTRAVTRKRKRPAAPANPTRPYTVSASASLDTIFEICALLVPEQGASEIDLIARTVGLFEIRIATLAALFGRKRKLAGRPLFPVKEVTPLLEAAYLISAATDSELVEAQRYLAAIALFIRDRVMPSQSRRRRSNSAPHWSVDLAEAIGEPMYLFVLALLKAGHQRALHLTAVELEAFRTRAREAVDQCIPVSNTRTAENLDGAEAFCRRLRRVWRAAL
jgi:hypothetical protein